MSWKINKYVIKCNFDILFTNSITFSQLFVSRKGMENIIIAGAAKIPEVILNTNGIVHINGRWIEDLSSENYNSIMDWIESYWNDSKDVTFIEISLEYFSTRNLTSFLNIIRKFIYLITINKKVVINWYYESGDDEMLERGKYISSMVNMQFNYISVWSH
jgi:hypothetical protein